LRVRHLDDPIYISEVIHKSMVRECFRLKQRGEEANNLIESELPVVRVNKCRSAYLETGRSNCQIMGWRQRTISAYCRVGHCTIVVKVYWEKCW
jgi:hypothetical protein